MKVAVTGAGGFVGRHVVAELERRGLGATLLARRPPATGPVNGPANGPVNGPASAHRFVPFDLLEDPSGLYERAGRPDVVLHLAWGGLPNYRSPHHVEQERPAHLRLLATLVREGLRHVVVAGTCFEYGMCSGALAETLACTPITAYGQAKDALRRELELLRGVQPFELTWARLFYLWGEGQAENSLWPSLRRAVARGDPGFPMSGGEQLRDYLPVRVAAAHLVELALGGRGHGVVNVCDGKPTSVRSLVEGWIREQGWSIEPELGRFPYPEHEPMAFWGDATKLRACLQST
ncbi:MAG: NAD(P)-dependent oxidoreductase [Burkholderiales bacterium]|nr:NAD(P)-dependent oxidoreductase [Burkholderiales bacterium]